MKPRLALITNRAVIWLPKTQRLLEELMERHKGLQPLETAVMADVETRTTEGP